MAWLWIKDTVPEHRKMIEAGPAASWLWLCAIAYAQRQLTDGFIPDHVIPRLGVCSDLKPRRLAAICVRVGLFDRVESGYLVHDYHDHNPTAEEAEAHRLNIAVKRAAAGRLGGIRSGIVRRQAARKATKQTRSNAPKQNEAPSPPYVRTPYSPPFQGGRPPTRNELKQAREIRRIRFGRCQHDPPCASHAVCIRMIVEELRANAQPA